MDSGKFPGTYISNGNECFPVIINDVGFDFDLDFDLMPFFKFKMIGKCFFIPNSFLYFLYLLCLLLLLLEFVTTNGLIDVDGVDGEGDDDEVLLINSQ